LLANDTVQWSLGTLTPGKTGERRASFTLDVAQDEGTAVKAEAVLQDSGGRLTRADAVTRAESEVPLKVTLDASLVPVLPGDVLNVKLTVTNTSAFDRTGVKLQMRYPVGLDLLRHLAISDGGTCVPSVSNNSRCDSTELLSWDLGTLPAGTVRTLSLPPTVSSAVVKGSLIEFVAFVEDNTARSRTIDVVRIADPIFLDVPTSYWAFLFVETLADTGITRGCDAKNYCPGAPVTRAQMAVFLERGINGSDFVPPTAGGNFFNDVPASYWASGFIEQLFMDGITTGCGLGNYCPEDAVTREQMAVFLLRAKHGSAYQPPDPVGVFNDVVLNHWSAPWIEQLAKEGITLGCGNNNYCPKDTVTRDQMAVFLVRTFGL
jgi:hypothetical protein